MSVARPLPVPEIRSERIESSRLSTGRIDRISALPAFRVGSESNLPAVRTPRGKRHLTAVKRSHLRGIATVAVSHPELPGPGTEGDKRDPVPIGRVAWIPFQAR